MPCILAESLADQGDLDRGACAPEPGISQVSASKLSYLDCHREVLDNAAGKCRRGPSVTCSGHMLNASRRFHKQLPPEDRLIFRQGSFPASILLSAFMVRTILNRWKLSRSCGGSEVALLAGPRESHHPSSRLMPLMLSMAVASLDHEVALLTP